MLKSVLYTALIILFASFQMPEEEKEAYAIFNIKGKETNYDKMLKKVLEADVVFFGELHDNPICHWLQAELLKDAFAKRKTDVVLGAEMFEADNQTALDSFLNGLYTDKQFATAARLWPNYKTDYKPLVLFAKENKLPFIATNIPRRYASMVFKRGFLTLDSLTELEKTWMAPLPMAYDSTLPGYRDILIATGGHGGPTLPMAQASKDATMAYFIQKNYRQGQLFMHFNGTYHSNNFEGIIWYLKRYNPNIKVVTISSVMQVEIEKLDAENRKLADFTLAIPESMTRTY